MSQTGNQVKSHRALPTNVPMVRTSFVGREREMKEVMQLLTTSRLVTLTGAAGCGKTRLALRVAHEISDRYAHGAHWIELARLADPTLVPQTVARTLRVPEQAERPALEGLLDTLRERRLLLVLDNCERLLSACARLVESVLAETDASILTTSREPLSVTGERLYPLAPLSLPPGTMAVDAVDRMGQSEAVQLFVERARAILPAFNVTAGNAEVIADICRRLDGVPLAIELASARLNVLTAEQILERLDNQLEVLSRAPHVTESHHDTLRAAIEWSHDLLSEPEQILLRRLSVFAGGCSLTTAETVCVGDGVEEERMLDLLSSLVKKSLVEADTLFRGEARYSLLESIRQYAQEKLVAAGERPSVRDRHLHCFLQLTEEAAPKLKGQYQQLWLNWLEGEYDNIRAAFSWSLENGPASQGLDGGPATQGLDGGPATQGLDGGPATQGLDGGRIEAGLRIAIAIYQFWTVGNYMEEGASWLERLLAQVDEGIPAAVHAEALARAAFLAEFRGQSAAQMTYGEEAAALAEALGDTDKPALAWALQAQAFGARAAGDEERGFALYKRLAELYRESGDRYRLSEALTTCGIAAMSLGRYEEARVVLDEALPLVREVGDPYSIAMSLNFAGDLARCRQNYTRAKSAYEESIALLRDLDAARQLASALHNLGHTYLHLDDVERARALFSESMALQREQQNRAGIAECLIGYAALAVCEGLPAAGARLLAAAVAIGGERVATAWAATRMEYDSNLEQVRAGLSEGQFQTEQTLGRTLSLVQAVAYAHEVADEAAAAQRAREKVEELTPREREVAVLIAQAKSNGEIAEELVVSKRTVEKHIANIRSKLAFTKRAQIVRWAMRSGLVDANG